MQYTRGRVVGIAALAALTLAACGGSDDPEASGDPTDGGDGPTSAPSPSETGPDASCGLPLTYQLPESSDPDSCWAVAGATDPVIVGETVFAIVPEAAAATGGTPSTEDPMSTETTEEAMTLAAYNIEDGKQLWVSDPLTGPISDLHAAEVDGEPGVAVLVTENDEGDAVTEASQAWGYLAWPGEVDDDTPGEAPVHITAPINPDVAGSTEVIWTDQGVLAGNQLLKPGATEFTEVTVDTEPVVIGDYDLDETLVGISGDSFLSYATGVAYTEDGGEDGDTYNGWVGRGADGTQAWDNLVGTPNTDDSLFGEGPSRMPLVIGDYALTVIPTNEEYTEYQLQWLDANGKEAAPKPADLVGAEPRGGAAAVMTNNVAALLTPSADYLFVYWSTLALVIDINAGTVKWVDSDFEITGTAIDDTTVYGRTESGTITIDLATATATPVTTAEGEPSVPVLLTSDGYDVFTMTNAEAGEDYLVVARHGG